MAKCAKCGHDQVPDNASFCPECGTGLDADPEGAATAPTKKANFSETMWFKEGGEEAKEDGESGPLVDSDFQLERSKLQDKYAREKLDQVVREKFTLDKD